MADAMWELRPCRIREVLPAASGYARSSGIGPQPTDRILQGQLSLRGVRVVLVLVPRPEESSQPVPSPPRDDVDVQMWDALAHAVVEGDERALGVEAFLH